MGGQQPICRQIHKICPQNSIESHSTIKTIQKSNQSEMDFKMTQTQINTKLNTESKSQTQKVLGSRSEKKISLSENINGKEEKSINKNHQLNFTCVRARKNRFIEDRELEVRFIIHQMYLFPLNLAISKKEEEFKKQYASQENNEYISQQAKLNSSQMTIYNQNNSQVKSEIQLNWTQQIPKFGKQFKTMSTEKKKNRGILKDRAKYKSLGQSANSKGSSLESGSELNRKKVSFDKKTNFGFDRDYRYSNWIYY